MPAAAYPMHVLPVARLLQLQRLPTHEEIKEELVLQCDGMHTVFVSQTWLSRAHPDNGDNAKLKLLQSFLRDGKKGVRPSLISEIFWGGRLKIPARALRKIQYVWLDVFSIPQADRERQGEAIASIPIGFLRLNTDCGELRTVAVDSLSDNLIHLKIYERQISGASNQSLSPKNRTLDQDDETK